MRHGSDLMCKARTVVRSRARFRSRVPARAPEIASSRAHLPPSQARRLVSLLGRIGAGMHAGSCCHSCRCSEPHLPDNEPSRRAHPGAGHRGRTRNPLSVSLRAVLARNLGQSLTKLSNPDPRHPDDVLLDRMASCELEAACLLGIVDYVAKHAEPHVEPEGINRKQEAGHGSEV